MSEAYLYSGMKQLGHTAGTVPFVYVESGDYVRASSHTDAGNIPNVQNFNGTISNVLNSYYEIDNTLGYNSIGFYLSPPSGGKVTFQGTFDSDKWIDMTLREIGGDGYTKYAYHIDSFIGSIATAQKIRILTSATGSSDGVIAGRLTKEVCTLEGQENGPPPHKFGNEIKHYGFGFNTATNGSGLWFPPYNKRFIVTDIQMSIDGNNNVVTLFESGNNNLNNPNSWVFISRGAAQATTICSNLRTPYVATGLGAPLMIASSSTAYIYGTINGYEAD